MVVEWALHIVSAALGRAHRAQRKSPRMVGIDQLIADRWRFWKYAEPAERIDPLEGLDRRRLDAGAADAVKTVAAGDEIAGDLAGNAVLGVSHARVVGVEIKRFDLAGPIDRGEAGGLARIHQ